MRRLALWLALAAIAIACGRYGAPHREPRAPRPAQSVPVTDPMVSP
jgi:hypothetical protein